jgi:hypothetical protein
LSHSSTYAAGSTISRCTTYASQLVAHPDASRSSQRPVPEIDPVGEDLRPATLGEVVRGRAHDVLDHAVAGQAGVAVDQPLAGRRGDHERRVGGDQVEALAATGSKKEPVADVDRGATSLSAALKRVIQQRALG